jgi:DNA-binding SARP family transcriptional activator/tetratricopeptide (TPR) repeat protein
METVDAEDDGSMPAETEFCLLGPLMVRRAGAVVPVSRGKQRAVLAALLLNANRIVSLDELAEMLWGSDPPASARVTVQNYVKRLRHVLGDAEHARIRTEAGGYLICAGPGELDVSAFEALAEAARTSGQDGAWDRASACARQALALWRGEPLADAGSPVLAGLEAPRLAEIRLQLLETRLDSDLHLGGHAEVLPELQRLVRLYPLRERLHATLMLALYRSGRQAESLIAYQVARRVLVDEVGTEPGMALRELHQQILAADPALTAEPGSRHEPRQSITQERDPGGPRQLPLAVGSFTGRERELAALSALLDRAAGRSPGTIVISAISGTAGVGKTALAVHWAHRVRDRFPEGQLFVNLRGYDQGEPVTAAEALAVFLRALGVPANHLPASTDERAARFRDLLAGRRMLILLDNAIEADQVRPLLPASDGCLVVVTSRDSLAGLVARDGAQRLELDLLPLADAVSLLRTLIGVRAEAHPEVAEELARQCCRLPLALRVAAEVAVARPEVPLADLVSERADRQHRLDVLDADGDATTMVRSVFSWSYLHLDDATARAFRLVGLHPGLAWDRYAVAALADSTTAEADQVISALTRAHLVQETGWRRYAMHDLLRAYASELAATPEWAEKERQALPRLFDYYLHTAATAMDKLYPAGWQHRPPIAPSAVPAPPLADRSAAKNWLDAERANLVAAAAHAARHGLHSHATRLSATLSQHFDAAGHYPEALALHAQAITAARRACDRAAEADALTAVGVIEYHQGRYPEAADHYQLAMAMYRQTMNRMGEGLTLGHLGLVYWQQGHYQQATRHFEQALALHRATGDRTAEGRTLGNLGLVSLRQGRYQQAAGHLEQALAVHRETGNKRGEAHTLGNLGDIALRQGSYQQATGNFEQALTLSREMGDPVIGAYALSHLGEVQLRQGGYQQAITYHRQALSIFRQTGNRPGEAAVLNGLGEVHLAAGRPAIALAQYAAAQALADQIGDTYKQALAHLGMARAHHADGDCGEARPHWDEALRRYTALGAPEADWVRAQLQLC